MRAVLLIAAVSSVAMRSTPVREEPPCSVTYKYYAVRGEGPEAIREQLLRRGPKDREGIARYAYTGWHLKWRWPVDNGIPDFSGTRVSCDVSVVLPRWLRTKRSTIATYRTWKRLEGAIIEHENQHLANVEQFAGSIEPHLRRLAWLKPGLTTEDANMAANGIVRQIQSLDGHLDSGTDFGRTQGVRIDG